MKTEVLQVSPKMAIELLKKNVKNRVLNRHKVAEFMSLIEHNQWKLTHQGICFSITDRLIDGQHRLTAIAKGKKSVPVMCVNGLPDDIMTVIDRGKTRSIADSFALMEVTNSTNIAAAISLYERIARNGYATDGSGNSSGGMYASSVDEKYQLYLQHQPIIDKLHSLSIKCYGSIRMFTTSQICAIGIHLIIDRKESFARVSEFWLQVHNISDQGQSSGTKLLHNSIIKYMTGSEKMKHRYKIAITIKAWNLFKTGGQAKILKYDTRELFPEFL